MTIPAAIATVRACLQAIKPEADIDSIADDTALLENRVITSFDVLELILQLEQAAGRAIERQQLAAGSFRDIRTIARVFLEPEEPV